MTISFQKSGKYVVVVESPTKSRKIWGMLKSGDIPGRWSVLASFGHIWNLPAKSLGVKTDDGSFELEWERIQRFFRGRRSKSSIKEIIEEAKSSKAIFLAPDPDREGEAIAHHIFLELQKAGVKAPILRSTFNAVTKKDVLNAIKNPRDLDMALVHAQSARRALDRVIGYRLSPPLWKAGPGLSVGRVQSCALASVVAKEQDIRQFQSERKYRLTFLLKSGVKAVSETDYSFPSRDDANKFLSYVQSRLSDFQKSFSVEKDTANPWPAMTTSSLLQSAAADLGMNSKDAMAAAQSLFEQGAITYHRTDSPHLSWPAVSALRSTVSANAQWSNHLSSKPRNYPMKGQGAHEAIRPTHPDEEKPKGVIGRNLERMYRLIRLRALATQGAPALLDRQKMIFELKTKKYGNVRVVLHGVKVRDPGWTAICPRSFGDPLLKTDKLKSAKIKRFWTQPPRRYTEAEVLRWMENKGVGRPSTYSATISTLMNHGYLVRWGKTLKPTLRGEYVTYLISKYFSDVLDHQFTAEMEKKLDVVASGRDYKKLMKRYWGTLQKWIKDAKVDPLVCACPRCKKGQLKLHLMYRGNPYMKCTDKKCDSFFGIDFENENIVPFVERTLKGPKCDCGGRPTLSQSKYGFFVRCPKCQKPIKHAVA